jgi:HAMP domain-containing protein
VRTSDLWRTTTFRLTLLYGAVFAFGVVALMGVVYWRTAVYLERRADLVVRVEAQQLSKVSAQALPQRIADEEARDVRRLYVYGLFSHDGEWITGNAPRLPPNLKIDGAPGPLPQKYGYAPGWQGVVVRLPWGELLLVGRDVSPLNEIADILVQTLVVSGVTILVAGLASGAALSLRPLRRIREIQAASRRIMAGDLAARLPSAGSGRARRPGRDRQRRHGRYRAAGGRDQERGRRGGARHAHAAHPPAGAALSSARDDGRSRRGQGAGRGAR